MNKKKKIKHKWWEHLLFKYKLEEKDDCYWEYSKGRIWFVLSGALLLIVFSPIIALIMVVTNIEQYFYYDDGTHNKDVCYTIYTKENDRYE